MAEESANRSEGPEENPHLDDVVDASPEEFEKLAATLSGQPGKPISVDQALARRELALRWIREDPEGLVEKLDSHTWIAWIWLEEEGAGLLDRIRGKVEPGLYNGLLHQLTSIDPIAVVEEVRQQISNSSDEPIHGYYLTESLVEIAKNDPSMAIVLVAEFSGRVKIQTERIAGQMARTNPEKAVDWALGLKSVGQRRESLSRAFTEWAMIDPEAAGESIAQISEEAGDLSYSMAHSFADQDPVAAVLWADRFAPAKDRANLISIIAHELLDPEHISTVYRKLENEKSKKEFVGSLLSKWGERDILSGYEWIKEISSEEDFEFRLAELASGVGSVQFDRAMEFSRDIEDPRLRELFQDQLIANLASEFPKKALALAKESGNDSLYHRTLDKALHWNAQSSYWSVEEIAEMLAELPADHPANAIPSLGERWVREDPDGAAAWMHSLEHPQQRRRAIRSVLGRMARTDPDAAAKQASRFTDPADRNEAYAALAKAQRDTDPAQAFAHANEIGYAERRTPLVRNIVHTWAKRDPSVARAAIDSAPALDERTKACLLARIYD